MVFSPFDYLCFSLKTTSKEYFYHAVRSKESQT